jgi:RND family efflux transporter MFP subunit
MRRVVPILIVSVLILVLGWRVVDHLLSARADSQGRSGRPPVAVTVAEVSVEPIQDVRLFTGTVFPQYRYLVATKVPGRVVALGKRIGDPVRNGEEIARLDDAEYRQAEAEARANLDIAKAGLEEARASLALDEKELARARSLRERDLISDADVDNARSTFEAQKARTQLAEAQVSQRQAALEASRIRLGYTRLLAAEPGYVGERLVDEGALLPVNAAVVSVVGLDTVFVRASVIERDYGSIRPGQEAQVEVDAFPGRRFSGRVSRLAPVLKEEARVAEMEVVVPNAGHELKPGMFSRVRVVIAAEDAAQCVPAAAVVRRDGHDAVYMADEAVAVARYVPVTLGIDAGSKVQILEPELRGRVITLGQHLLEDESPILLTAASGADTTRVSGGGTVP